MGNCIPMEAKVVKVIKMDGKVLEFRAPVKVFQVLSEFKGLAIIDSVPFSKKSMNPCAELVTGHLYHLVPIPIPSTKPGRKKVRFSVPEVEDEVEKKEATTSLKVKLVITKEQLKKMIEDGVPSTNRKISQIKEQGQAGFDVNVSDSHRDMLQRHFLDSLSEGSYSC